MGKSTLLNRLLGQKLSIVTPKAQTTRHRILGILSEPEHQIIFLDTPGIIRPRYGLHQSMMKTVTSTIAEADLLLFMADASEDRPDNFSLDVIGDHRSLLVLNKIDLVRPLDVVPLVHAYVKMRAFEAVIPVSALKGENIIALMSEIRERLPLGNPLYPEDMISEHPERFFVSEIVREKIFQCYRQEIPYTVAVNISRYEEHSGRKDLIYADIVVEQPSQKGILIGKGGRALKAVGIAARKDIEEFLGRPVYLKLYVQVRANWRNRERMLRSFGY